MDYQTIPSPCFVMNEELFRKNLELIKKVQDEAGVKIILAFKGFAMWSSFGIFKEYFDSAAASSVFEARLAFEELGKQAHTFSPAFDEKNFDEIIKYSSHITFNSLSQFNKFAPIIKNSGKKVSIGLRVNPEFSEVETDLYNPCTPGSRLGVPFEQLKHGLPDGIDGLHFHALCESNSYSLEKTLEAFESRFGKFIPKVKWVNMGGGHLMTRKDYDTKHLIHLLKNFKNKYQTDIILEPGSAFAWETGQLVSTVLDVVNNHGIRTAIVDVSFAAHMPDCLEMPYKPKILNATEPHQGKPVYRIGGNSCLAGDYMGVWSFEKDIQIGDKIVFQDMIHYTMVKTTMFNGVNHPSIGIWTKDNGFQLIREFCYEDYKNRLS